jgi:hypothetical protein
VEYVKKAIVPLAVLAIAIKLGYVAAGPNTPGFLK